MGPPLPGLPPPSFWTWKDVVFLVWALLLLVRSDPLDSQSHSSCASFWESQPQPLHHFHHPPVLLLLLGPFSFCSVFRARVVVEA